MATPPEGGVSGADLMRQFLPTSPYNVHLGICITTIEPGIAQLALPFTKALVTNGTIVHGERSLHSLTPPLRLPLGQMQQFPRRFVASPLASW